jgi:hypothetical protein
MREFVDEGGPVDQFHHNRRRTIGVFEAVNRGDVPMIQRREQPRFAGLEGRLPRRRPGPGEIWFPVAKHDGVPSIRSELANHR